MKTTLLQAARRIVHSLPRSRVFRFFAQEYIFHHYNLYDGHFERNGELRWLREVLVGIPRPVVFDVGANVGKWSQAALSINPACEIHAFEPFPDSYQALQQRFASNSNVHAVMQGLGAVPSEVAIQVFDDALSHNSLHGRVDRPAHRTASVQLTTLDTYCADHQIERIDFLKIDTEGHEIAVLQGASEMLSRGAINAIQIEYMSSWILARYYLKDLFDLLEPRGYRLYRIMPNQLQPVKYHEHLENFMHCHYAAIHDAAKFV